MKTEKITKSVWNYTMIKVWGLVIYTAIAHSAVLADNSNQQVLRNHSDFHASLPSFQSQYENLKNLTKNELSEMSTVLPELTSTTTLRTNLTMNGYSGTDVTKPVATFTTTKSHEVTNHRNIIETTSYKTKEETKSYRNGIGTSFQTDKATTSYQNGMETTSYKSSEITTNYRTTSKDTTTPDPTNKISKEQTLITRKESNQTITSKPSVSHVTAASPNITNVSNESAASTSAVNKVTTVYKTAATTQSLHMTDSNFTDEFFNSTVDPSRLTHTFAVDFQSRDSFWPIAMALTIGIPTIVVLAVTITVLYRGRMAKPRSLLAMYGQDYSQI